MRVLFLLFCLTNLVFAQQAPPDLKFEPRPGEQVNTDLSFIDSSGERVTLGRVLGGKPAVLVLGYYHCPSLCHQVQFGLVDVLKQLEPSVGERFQVVMVSIDPTESPELARTKKRGTLVRYGRESARDGWFYLTGSRGNVEELAASVGFPYTYDQELDQYAHPAGFVILDSTGTIESYALGISFEPDIIEKALFGEEKRRGSLGRQVQLLCYAYDPVSGKYSLSVVRLTRLLAFLTVLILVVYVLSRLRKESPGE